MVPQELRGAYVLAHCGQVSIGGRGQGSDVGFPPPPLLKLITVGEGQALTHYNKHSSTLQSGGMNRPSKGFKRCKNDPPLHEIIVAMQLMIENFGRNGSVVFRCC